MGTTSTVPRVGTRETDRQERRKSRETVTSDGDVLADIAKLILWPECTAAHLAAASGCSVRQAERYLGGYEWSGDAIAAVIAEILARKKMRNVKVTARK